MTWQDVTPPDPVKRGRKRALGAGIAGLFAVLVALDLLPAPVAEALRGAVDAML